jgi:hypothetical protein
MKDKTKNKTKRIKTYFKDIRDVAHLWALKSQDRARCRNAFFEGTKIYSYGYHYLLGELIKYNGVDVALINIEYASRTTSKHSSAAYWAAKRQKLMAIEIEGRFETGCILESLKIEQDRIINTLSVAQYAPFTWFGTNYYRDTVREFNNKTKKLGHKELVLKIPDSFYAEIKEVIKLKNKAYKDNCRRQGVLPIFSMWSREVRSLQKCA